MDADSLGRSGLSGGCEVSSTRCDGALKGWSVIHGSIKLHRCISHHWFHRVHNSTR
jgi:hypothetical protein